MACKSFKSVQHIIPFHECHFTVNLSEFRLAVGTQVFVTETFHQLVITIVAGNHQQLLKGLRRLRQCIKLSLMHP